MKRRKTEPRTVLLVGGPYDARTLSNPLPEVGESVVLAVYGEDEHHYLCETSGTATYTGAVTWEERVHRTEVVLSAPAPDPTK